MGFLDGLEKLITEHGSAAILKERIQLLNDRHAEVERQLNAVNKERDLLRSENAALRSQKDAIQAEIDEIRRLQEEADRKRQKDLAGANRLPADRETILKVICFHPDCEAAQVARIAGLGLQIAQWHIDELEKAGLVRASYQAGTPWSSGGCFLTVAEDGRAYLAVNGMLQS